VRQRQFLLAVIGAALILLPASSPDAAARKPPWRAWKSKGHLEHTLTGRVYAAKKGLFLTPIELADKLAVNDYILLGETHDNLDHHILQAWLINRIAHYDRRPAIVWEMIDLNQSLALANHLKNFKLPAAKLGDALDWGKSGWPAWSTYLPIARRAYQFRLAMSAGSARKEDVKEIGQKGLASVEESERERLGLDFRLGWDLTRALRQELKASHCDMLPDEALENMQDVQRYRDAILADQLLAAGSRKGAVLIAGSGHVRHDRAVPWYLRNRNPDASIVTLMLIEVTEETAFAEDFVPKDPFGKPTVDYVWFTPRHERTDPCEAFKKQLDKKKK